MKRDLFNATMLLIILAAMAQSCGSSSSSEPKTQLVQTGPNQAVVTVFNSGTQQDQTLGTVYTFTQALTTTVPSIVLRTQGTTQSDGRGVGTDYGTFQCYYDADVNSQNVFALDQCTGNYVAGTPFTMSVGSSVTLWTYKNVSSDDSEIELVLQGETQ